MNSGDKTPTGRASKGEASVFSFKGRLKANLPRQYFEGEQKKISLGLKDTPENIAVAERIVKRMTMDLQDGCFDITLEKYLGKAKLTVVASSTPVLGDSQLPPKVSVSVLEVWGMYLEYMKPPRTADTTYYNSYCKAYTKNFESAVSAVGEKPTDIRTWLLSNRSKSTARRVLSFISRAYELAVNQGTVVSNPFFCLLADLDIRDKSKIANKEDEQESEDDFTDKTKAYTWNEAMTILDFVQNTKKISYWYPYLAFKFLTGCRTGEASGFKWKDVKWDVNEIWIRRGYCWKLKQFITSKNDSVRRIPMPVGSDLWVLLKSVPEGQPDEVVFKSRKSKTIHPIVFAHAWGQTQTGRTKGFIIQLIEQGKISKYLPPYNTRHTFITHQIYDLGIPSYVVSAWCEHSTDVSKKHYQDSERYAMQYTPNSAPVVEKSELALLQEQNALLQEQMKAMQEMMEKLKSEK